MDKFAFGLIAAFAAALMMFIIPLMGVLFGALGGWVVGLFFEQTMRAFMAAFGINSAGLAMWQVGAGMGFFGAYIKSVHTSKG